jgi:hypothetical protein
VVIVATRLVWIQADTFDEEPNIAEKSAGNLDLPPGKTSEAFGQARELDVIPGHAQTNFGLTSDRAQHNDAAKCSLRTHGVSGG